MRKIINIKTSHINFLGIGEKKVKLIYWCIPNSETKTTYKSEDLRLTITTGKVSTTSVYYFGKKIKSIPKNINTFNKKYDSEIAVLYRRVFKPSIGPGFATNVYSNYLDPALCIGTVVLLNEGHQHYPGLIKTLFGDFHFYDCNSSSEIIKTLEKGMKVRFKLPSDVYTLHQCGVVDISLAGGCCE